MPLANNFPFSAYLLRWSPVFNIAILGPNFQKDINETVVHFSSDQALAFWSRSWSDGRFCTCTFGLYQTDNSESMNSCVCKVVLAISVWMWMFVSGWMPSTQLPFFHHLPFFPANCFYLIFNYTWLISQPICTILKDSTKSCLVVLIGQRTILPVELLTLYSNHCQTIWSAGLFGWPDQLRCWHSKFLILNYL